jgi:hypothetical protein
MEAAKIQPRHTSGQRQGEGDDGDQKEEESQTNVTVHCGEAWKKQGTREGQSNETTHRQEGLGQEDRKATRFGPKNLPPQDGR